ncbi:SDR family oxidoreductase [Paenibacillus thiaminolyticus]|uniref:SDR family NAD(P)-dependent oxidoreductase n=1 Tax=Paenibacillus thiaminolyticus TaxID=49283 RepID=UPI001163EC82|nr:SDR family oxidoreductase [Paenibacillus thiaminolyticus]NGP58292.1 SDR family oxidoreductase [Paenibacillus thiaminolyticus]WCR26654.1 SDR family oxidoreductase [Paenibacillus thiaminolyticus]
MDKAANAASKETRLSGKVALITGAAGGIGSHLAQVLHEHHMHVVMTDLPAKRDELEKLQDRLEQPDRLRAVIHELDLCDVEAIGEIVDKVIAEFGRIDVLINNAGINVITPSIGLTPEQWDLMFHVNLRGAFFLTQQAARYMIQKKDGHIINIASQHGVVGNEDRVAYCASKAGLIQATRALAVEWAKYNLKVNSISPTFVFTKSNKELFSDHIFQHNTLRRIPLRRYAVPDDIADAVLYMIQSDMLTGHNLVVDGGWTAR